MTAQPPRQKVQLALSGIVMTGVLLASIAGITEVAALVRMPTVTLPEIRGIGPVVVPIGTVGLILAWDGMQVTAAWASHTGRDRLAVILLVLTATASGAAQGWAGVLAVLQADPGASFGFLAVVAVVHASPAVFLIGAEGLVFRAAGHASDQKQQAKATSKPRQKPARSAPSAPRTATTPPPPPPAPAGQSEPGAGEAARPTLEVVGRDTPRPSRDDIAEKVDAWLAEQGRRPTKQAVMDAGAALDLPCRSGAGALPILRLVKERRELAS